jgi:hypothetical protein
MNFSVTKKKLEKEELYPGVPVLIQNGTSFQFNEEAMRRFGFPLNRANVSKITNGFDDENKLALAVLNTDTAYTNNVTAKNTFSSAKLTERLISQFGGGILDNRLFKLDFIDGDMKAAYILEYKDYELENYKEVSGIVEKWNEEAVAEHLEQSGILPEPPIEVIIEDSKEEVAEEVATEVQPSIEAAISNVAKTITGW